MRAILSERNIVVILFVLVLVTFSLAQEDSKKMEQLYSGTSISAVSRQLASISTTTTVQEKGDSKEKSSVKSE
jgi:hypothetical protein